MRGDTKTTKHYRKIRQELATMLGYSGDPDTLPIDQSTRLDVVFGLKIALDEQRGRMYRGEPIGTAEMLKLSEALDRYLPKQPEPEAVDPDEGVDPHQKLIDMVDRWIDAKADERRAQGLSEPVTDLTEAQARIDALEAENARLRGDRPAPEAFERPVDGEIVEPEPQAVPQPSPPPQPRPFVNGLSDVPRSVRDSRPAHEPWRPYSHLFD